MCRHEFVFFPANILYIHFSSIPRSLEIVIFVRRQNISMQLSNLQLPTESSDLLKREVVLFHREQRGYYLFAEYGSWFVNTLLDLSKNEIHSEPTSVSGKRVSPKVNSHPQIMLVGSGHFFGYNVWEVVVQTHYLVSNSDDKNHFDTL